MMNRFSLIMVFLTLSTLFAYPYSQEEIEGAMRRLSPLVDLANTRPEIFANAAATTLRATEEMPWGKSVPEREFLHFVVPLRVNNEPLDNHRPVIYAELSDRVKGLGMKEAILEVNHWCHEYVTYQPSDGRTHSPLQSMSSLQGRCGEESTFTVAALRAVGIPARQVYTPRWAHTDDNHAWVEAWADGEWHFLGACEPEPVLDLAWFNAPATRGMMMHTFVRGDYDGPEETVDRSPEGVTINVTANYAPTVCTTVQVVDKDGKPVKDAEVAFRIYNYAELYPLALKVSDSRGMASLTTGLGDMVVSVAKEGKTVWRPVTASADSIVEISIDTPSPRVMEYMLTPPPPGNNPAEVSEAQKESNNARLQMEDAMRELKAGGFVSPEEAAEDALLLDLPKKEWSRIMALARGNGKILQQFIRTVPREYRILALRILSTLSEKDFSDITPEVLTNHIYYSKDYPRHPLDDYILAPRVALEFLSPWRGFLRQELEGVAQDCRANPGKWVHMVKERVRMVPDWTPSSLVMNPEETWKRRSANALSRDVLFVAGARAMGIPARIDPVSANVQWGDDRGNWHDVTFDDDSAEAAPKGKLSLVASPGNKVANPGYYRHFSIVKIYNGLTRQLDFDEDASYDSHFRNPVELDCGEYMLVTGQRLANGGVLVHSEQFTIRENQTTEVPLVVRHDDSSTEVIGNFNSENLYYDYASGSRKSILSATGRGYYVLGFLQGRHEPSNHAMRDIAAIAGELDETGIPFLILSDQDGPRWLAELALKRWPQKMRFGKDDSGDILREATAALDLPESGNLPVFIVADTFNRVVFVSNGYTIGLGQQLHDILEKLRR